MVVVFSLVKRWFLVQQYLFLGLCRSFRLWGFVNSLFYACWLYSGLGWSRLSSYKFEQSLVLRSIFLMTCVYFCFNLKFVESVSNYMYSLFSTPVMSDTGYIGYTVFASCFLVYLLQAVLLLSSKSYREILGPYYPRLITLNVVCLVILLSIFSQISRIKFGIRVWYPSERVYGEHSTLNYWDW